MSQVPNRPIIQKQPPLVIQALRDAARGMPCTFQVVGVCNHNPLTTVLCHSNAGEDGKGMGQKADDNQAAFGCSACHTWFDQATDRDHAEFVFKQALKKTHRFCWENGIFKVDAKAAHRERLYA